MEQQPSQSWWRRHWILAVIAGCLLSLAAMVACGAMLLPMILWWFKSSDAYANSLDAVRADSEVRAALGDPMEPGLLVFGHIQISNTGGYAQMSYNVSGPKGKGTVYVFAYKETDHWVFKTLAVVIEDSGDKIDVLANQEADKAANEAI